jgi:hypothetical protein
MIALLAMLIPYRPKLLDRNLLVSVAQFQPWIEGFDPSSFSRLFSICRDSKLLRIEKCDSVEGFVDEEGDVPASARAAAETIQFA